MRSPARRSSQSPRESASRLGSRMLSRTDWFITRPSRRSPGTMPMPAAMASTGLLSLRVSSRTCTCVGPATPNRRRSIRSVPLPSRPGEADRLARAHPNTMVAVRLGGEQHLAGRDWSGEDLVGRASGHRGHQIVHREGAASAHRRDPPVAQHRAAVGDRHHLVEAVRDIDDGGALPFHAGKDGEQSLDLALFQCRGRLVEDEDAALPTQRFGDRHQLALGEAQRRHRPVGIGIEVELAEHRARLLAHARAIDHRERAEAAHRQVAERDVLGDRQRRHQPQLLRNGHDAGGDGVVRA